MDKKFTGSYANTEKNFMIMNLAEDNLKVNDEIFSVLSVVQNIIKRGKVARPSEYLKEQLGVLDEEEIKEAYCMVTDSVADWGNIKGDELNSFYPAEEFFEFLLKLLGNRYFLRNLIIPEADFEDIIGHSTAFDGQTVDFYIPQIKAAIEIDGSSHDTLSQNKKDTLRDKELKRNGITVFRITTSDLREKNKNLVEVINRIFSMMKASSIIRKYEEYYFLENTDGLRKQYDAVYRMQMAFIECLKNGMIDVDAKRVTMNVVSDDVLFIEQLAHYAYEDINLWCKAIGQIAKVDINLPKIIIKETKKNNLCFDVSLEERYTDKTIKKDNTVYIRTGYFFENDYYVLSEAEKIHYKFTEETEKADNSALCFLLKNVFGFDNFNEGQMPIIKNVLERNDTIGILPTGGGKSLTYQICALLQPGFAVVIEPIISLIQDQKKSMDKIRFDRTALITSNLNGAEKDKVINEMKRGKHHIVWCSPERFQNKEFREAFISIDAKVPLYTAVIDEVHCLSEWGHDFRVSYLALIGTIRQHCKNACLVGLTATASQAVIQDLKAEFGFDNDGSGIKAIPSMNREELLFNRITVQHEEERLDKIKEIVRSNSTSYTNLDGTVKKKLGLLFCPTIGGKKNSSCENVSAGLKKSMMDLKISEYYGRLSSGDKTSRQNQFMNDELDLMVCTKAFGMGIDKDNVKYTIHCSLPQSVESFYQEAGRAGRESDKSVKSNCYIVYNPEKSSVGNDIVPKIFNAGTDVVERKSLSRKLSGDLETLMFFWNINKKTVEDEYRTIREVLALLYKGKRFIEFDGVAGNGVFMLPDLETALYKIYLLGIIENWSIKYNTLNNGFVEIEIKNKDMDEELIYEELLRYIRKYDSDFQIEKKTEKYKVYYDIAQSDEKTIPKLFKILIQWSNDNILYNRLQSTNTIREWMDPKVTDNEFRQKIEEYFKFSEMSIILDNIVQNSYDYLTWFEILYSRVDEITNEKVLVDAEHSERLLASLQRYLESYRFNTGLNFLSGMLRMIVGRYENTEGEWRFRDALNSIKEGLDKKEAETVIANIIQIGKTFSAEKKDILSRELLNVFPEKMIALHRALQDRYSLSIIIEEQTKRVRNVLKEI